MYNLKSNRYLKTLIFILLFFQLNAQGKSENQTFKDSVELEKLNIDESVRKEIHFKKNFQNKYNSKNFNYSEKKIEEGLWERFKRWFFEQIQKLFGTQDPNKTEKIATYILNTIAVLIISFAIYLIIKVLINKEGQWIFGKTTSKKIINHQDIEKNLQNVDFEKLIKETEKQGNKRLAVRYYYLYILKKLSEKSIINWNPEKTNSDYFYEIKNEKLQKDFEYASYIYNNIWYGEFELDQEIFDIAQQKFKNILNSI